MKHLISLALGLILITSCSSTNPNTGPMTHAAFTAAVTLGEQLALEQKPEAIPYVRAAARVVCAAADGTNVSPASIVDALQAAGVTNQTAKIVINGSLAIFNVVVSGLGTNESEIRLYGQDLCSGLTAGLPDAGSVLTVRKTQLLPPHLR